MRKDFISTGITRMVILLVSLVSLPILVRALGEENYGSYVLVLGAVNLIIGVSNLGIGYGAMRKLPSSLGKAGRGDIFYPQFYANIFIAIAIFSLVIILGHFTPVGLYLYQYGISMWLIAIYLLIYPLYTQLDLLFKFSGSFTYLNILHISLTSSFLLLLFAIVNSWTSVSVDDIFIAHVVSVLFTLVLLGYKVIQLVGFKFVLFTKSSFLFDIRHGIPIVMTTIAHQVTNVSDRYVISYFLPLESVAHYAVAATVASMLLFIPRVMAVVIQPNYSKLFDQNNLTQVSILASKNMLAWLAIAVPATIGALLLGENFLSMYVSPEVGENGGAILWVLILGAVFFGIFILFSTILFSAYKTESLFKMSATAALLNLFLNLILMYFFKDILTAAIATSLSYLVLSTVAYREITNILDFRINFIESSKIIMAASLTGFLVYLTMMGLTHDFGFGTISLLILEYALVYAICLGFIKSEVLFYLYQRL